MNLINAQEKARITQILREKGYKVLAFGEIDNKVAIGIVPIYHEEISAKLSELIKNEVGVEALINL